MKYCEKCGAKNRDDAKFCESCGASLPKVTRAPARERVKTPEVPVRYRAGRPRVGAVVVIAAIVGIAALIAVLALTGVLRLGGGGPDDTIKASAEAINARNVDKVYSLYSSRIKAQYTKDDVSYYLNTTQPNISDLQILNVNIADNTASVRWRAKFSTVTGTATVEHTTPLIKENGEWKLDEF